MGQLLALVTLENWMAYVLILLSCGSLVLALWCFLFMASEKKVGLELHSMGGSFEGIENRLSEIHNAVAKKIDDIELKAQVLISQTRDALREDLSNTDAKAERALASAENIMAVAEQLKAAQVSFSGFRDDVSTRLDQLSAVAEDIAEIRAQMVALETDLKDSVKDQVGESFQQLDSTILAVLETIQGEMLRSVDRLRDIQDTVVSRSGLEFEDEGTEEEEIEEPMYLDEAAAPRSPGNIIAAEPLFACLASKSEPFIDEDVPCAEPEDPFVPAAATVDGSHVEQRHEEHRHDMFADASAHKESEHLDSDDDDDADDVLDQADTLDDDDETDSDDELL